MPSAKDKFRLNKQGKIKERYIFDLDAEYTDFEITKLLEFKKYGYKNLAREDRWL